MNDEMVRASDEEVDAFLEHFGVLGMHWGVRNQRNRQLNRESRQKDREKHEKQVRNARKKIKSGKMEVEWATAKAKFHKDKEKLGSREARKILNKTRDKHWAEFNKSQEAANGKEAALIILGVAGAIGVHAFLSSKIDRGF